MLDSHWECIRAAVARQAPETASKRSKAECFPECWNALDSYRYRVSGIRQMRWICIRLLSIMRSQQLILLVISLRWEYLVFPLQWCSLTLGRAVARLFRGGVGEGGGGRDVMPAKVDFLCMGRCWSYKQLSSLIIICNKCTCNSYNLCLLLRVIRL